MAGILDGEGSFYTSARRRNDSICGWRFTLTFNIAQNDKKLLQFCKDTLECANIRQTAPSKKDREYFANNENEWIKREKYILEVTNLQDLKHKGIPFFKKYNFRSTKKAYELGVFEEFVDFLMTTSPNKKAYAIK